MMIAYVVNKNKTAMEVEHGTDDEEMHLAAEMLGLPSDHFATEEKKLLRALTARPRMPTKLC